MSTVDPVNGFRAYHPLLSIIDTTLKKLRVGQVGETDSPHPIDGGSRTHPISQNIHRKQYHVSRTPTG